jgi:hypothetical protein
MASRCAWLACASTFGWSVARRLAGARKLRHRSGEYCLVDLACRIWWSMVLDHSFGQGILSREKVAWPGSAEGVREWLAALRGTWWDALEQLSDEDLRSTQRTRWPFQNRPFGDVAAWVNLELTKNAAEIGYARFLFAVRTERSRD